MHRLPVTVEDAGLVRGINLLPDLLVFEPWTDTNGGGFEYTIGHVQELPLVVVFT